MANEHDGRFKVLPEYSRDGWISGWNIARDGQELAFFYLHSRAMTVAQQMARDAETCPNGDLRCSCAAGKGHRAIPIMTVDGGCSCGHRAGSRPTQVGCGSRLCPFKS